MSSDLTYNYTHLQRLWLKRQSHPKALFARTGACWEFHEFFGLKEVGKQFPSKGLQVLTGHGSFHRAKCQDLKHLSVETTNCAFIWAQDQFPVRRCHKLAGFFHGFPHKLGILMHFTCWKITLNSWCPTKSLTSILDLWHWGRARVTWDRWFACKMLAPSAKPKAMKQRNSRHTHVPSGLFVSHTNIATSVGDRWRFRILCISSLLIYTYITHRNSRAQSTTWYLNDTTLWDCICRANRNRRIYKRIR